MTNSLSIKWRVSLAATLMALLLIASISAVGLALLRVDLADSIAIRQSALVRQVAQDLDAKLAADLELVARAARALPEAAVHDGAAFRDHFAHRPELFSTFDSFGLIRPDGTPLAGFPPTPGRSANSYADRGYFQDVLRTGKPVISEPLLSKVDPQPIVVMAAPIRGPAGVVEGVLVAVLSLRQPNMLGNLATAKVGKSGYFFLVTRSAPSRYVVHPDASRILMERPSNATRSTARAIEGFEGTVEDTNSSGINALFSYAGLRTTGWVLASVLPADEAFAPLRTAGHRAAGVALLAALLVGPLVWFLSWRLLAPLSRLSASIQQTLRGEDQWTDFAVERSDEIGTLAQSFNALIGKLEAKEAALKTSEQWLRSVTDNLPALVCYIGPDHRFRFNNKTYEKWLRRPLAEIEGKHVREVYGADVYERLAPSLEAALAGTQTKFEVEFEGRDGKPHYARGQYVPHRDGSGAVVGVFGLITDETRLKMAEKALVESEKRLLDITNNLPAVIGHFDMQEKCVFANDVGLKAHGIRRSELANLTFGSHIEPALYEQHLPGLREVLSGRHSIVRGERRFGGRSVWFKAHLIPDFGPDGKQRGFYVMTFDISTVKAAELAHARSEQRLRDITDNLPVLISHIDAGERFTYANETFRTTMGFDRGGIEGARVVDVLPPDLYVQRRPSMQRCLLGERVACEVTSILNGELRHFQTTHVPDVQDGRVVGMTALSVDVTVLKTAERRLARLARFDDLTGLPNRLHFNEHLEEAFSNERATDRSRGSLALMFLDIDHFKQINDSLGHAFGDLVLQEFARRVSGAVRATDFCARLAGDEFVVVLDRMTTLEQAREVAGKVVRQVARPIVAEGRSIDVTVSVGVACDQEIQNAAELLARADAALYRAKEQGRNRFCLAA